MVGAGLCPGFTQSRAILSDAVALVRGDRFLTESYDAGTLTAWGLESTVGAASPDNGSYGGLLPALFMTNLPNSFRFNNLCVQFPLQTPKSMIPNLEKMGVLHKYDTTRPKELPEWSYVTDPLAIDAILDQPEVFNVPYKHNIATVHRPYLLCPRQH
jgi:linoleate 10R-lipoxygenase